MAYLLHQLIDEAVAKRADKQAFRFQEQSLTYGELVQRSNQLANLLRAQGVKRGDRVGIYMNRCLETAIAIYGTFKAGAAFVPIDPQQPAARVQHLLDNCGIQVLLTNRSQKRKLPAVLEKPGPLLTLIGAQVAWAGESLPWSAIDEMDNEDPLVRCLGSDLAYIIFSSGSTGKPKGIMHTHASGLAYARLSASLYDVNERDIIANFCALHFDQYTFGYLSSMLAGATTVIVPDAHTKFPVSLIQLIERERISIWYSVPLVMTQMLQSGVLGQHDLSSLRWVKFGGEAFSSQQLAELMPHLPNATFSNVYGPAEVNQCTFHHLSEAPAPDEPIPLGRVWDDTEILIFDESDQEVVPGEIGELLVRSSTRTLGYWSEPEMTERSFFRRAIGGIEAVYYRTGDLVCTSAGRGAPQESEAQPLLYFMGRKDRQVKIRGHRVEIEEVESILNGLTGVFEAAVEPVANGAEGKLLLAVVVTQGDGIDESGLKKAMATYLPPYAIPQKWVFTSELPRSGNGKIDHRRLQMTVKL